MTVNSTTTRFAGPRAELVGRIFPLGIPSLWCPALTHYGEGGTIDRVRMRAHLHSMQPWVRGFLIPGSTGEGWEMSDAEVRELLDVMIDEIREVGGQVLVGILKTRAEDVLRAIDSVLAWLRSRTGTSDSFTALSQSAVCGFTVCPPSGSQLSQEEIRAALESVLSLGVPFALYQLPQVTGNEMSAETLAALGERFPNFYLFKDTSGSDRVAASGFRDAFLVRGAEGDYANHLAAGGGNYDGFLLSTANCFGHKLHSMIEHVRQGNRAGAEAFSKTLTSLTREVFEVAGAIGYGNAFTNANKAMDHFFAHGPDAGKVAPPRLHCGRRLPPELIDAAGAALRRHGLMPKMGYLAGRA